MAYKTIPLLSALVLVCSCTVDAGGDGDGDGDGDVDAGAALDCTEDPTSIFERYVKPLVENQGTSSCQTCHASAVAIANYTGGTACESMSCMIAADMVDFDNPEDSKILELIEKATPSGLVTQEMIDREYDGFLSWIEFSSDCHEESCAGVTCGSGAPSGDPTPHLGGCSEEALIASFAAKVEPYRNRCVGCHGEFAPEPANGVLIGHWWDESGGESSPMKTMYNMMAYGVINTSSTAQSLLLTKPLVAEFGGVAHQGGDKIASPEGQTYVDFKSWIDQYAGCK